MPVGVLAPSPFFPIVPSREKVPKPIDAWLDNPRTPESPVSIYKSQKPRRHLRKPSITPGGRKTRSLGGNHASLCLNLYRLRFQSGSNTRAVLSSTPTGQAVALCVSRGPETSVKVQLCRS